MKNKILTIMLFVATMLLTSCGSYAQVTVGATLETELGSLTSYYYIYQDYPVVYVEGVPYCRFYANNSWHYRLIPVEQRYLIEPLAAPREFVTYHVSHPRYIHRPHVVRRPHYIHRPHGHRPPVARPHVSHRPHMGGPRPTPHRGHHKK